PRHGTAAGTRADRGLDRYPAARPEHQRLHRPRRRAAGQLRAWRGRRAGRIAVVAASGGVNHALAFGLAEAGHGVSLAVGLGNAADVTSADVLGYLADDPATHAVALHVESVADGRRLADAVRRLTPRVPVAVLVVGRHDVSAFAAPHTGALATSWRATRAALAQAG